ncbi:MAG: flagellar hook protein FlgE [Desulfobacterales bacterium]
MSLSSSLYSGISGLSALGNAMTVIGDNIANINTVGFKSSRVTFEDVLSQTVGTTSGTAQVGRGTTLAEISARFSQGSFESTDSPTDLAIGGSGFFVVRDPNEANTEYYTRSGEFNFDRDGNFTNPSGYIVRGTGIDRTTGVEGTDLVDIKLSSFTSPPDATEKITMIVNLDSTATDKGTGAGTDIDLSALWNGTDAVSSPLAETNYEYQTTVKVYDSLGTTHDVTIYFDKADTASTYEFIVTIDPTEDGRATFTPATDTGRGLLARGTVTFDTSGAIIDIDLDRFSNGGGNWFVGTGGNWTSLTEDAAGEMTNGNFIIQSTFTSGAAMNIEIDLGANGTAGDGAWVPRALASTTYASTSTTVFQSSDGYGAGDLQSTVVATDGIITGQYSNGQVVPLFRVALSKFQNDQGLEKMGGNLYNATRISGSAITSKPGTNGLGSLSPNSLEQSNVDIATEFVKMIVTQRGFQANSKIITVTDQMLADLINLKR